MNITEQDMYLSLFVNLSIPSEFSLVPGQLKIVSQ